MSFEPVDTQTDFVKLEHEVLDFWKRSQAFEKLRRLRKGGPTWSFIDGPITANNPMGVHHGWGRSYKDLWHRFWAMQGCEARYQNGFDCQGLWVEVELEKEKGFQNKLEIESYGLDKFVLECKARVLRQAARQTEQSIRLGYWMDWNDPDTLRYLADKLLEDPQQIISIQGPDGPVRDTVESIVGRLGMPEIGGSYFTFATENNYTIWTFLKKVWQKGWLYKGHDVMPWCSRCATGISQHEIVTDGYRKLTHEAPVLRFPLRGRGNTALLVWTTTPWTLTSNVAVAVGPELSYVQVRSRDGWTYYLAGGTVNAVLRKKYTIVSHLKGRDMLGWEYEGPFDELPLVQELNIPQYHKVIPWNEVGDDEGTGLVHIAPGCGAEDYELGKEYKLPSIAPLSEEGNFIAGLGWLTGRNVHDVAHDIFRDLESKGRLYRVDPYTHRYPVCWRCGTPLVFRLVDEWFIDMGPLYDKPRSEVTEEEKAASLRYQIMEVVDQIKWIPDFGYDRELDWLRNMHDWMISKKRYWGLALPIWVCDNPDCEHYEVIGDEDELRERAVEGWETFEGHTPHRPYVDAIKLRCPQCGGVMSRVKDVGNPWLDAGSVAYSTTRYRTDREYWRKWVPADWISESFPGQFRNWFYSLITMSTVFESIPPTKIVHGYATLLAEDGRPMHKSWGNAIWFDDAAEKMGVDTMRWLYLNQRLDQNLLFGYNRADEARRRFIIPLWNVYSFFITYARIDAWSPPTSLVRHPAMLGEGHSVVSAEPWTQAASPSVLDRWIIARLRQTILAMNEGYRSYVPVNIAEPAEWFLDDLSNWYVRRSRRRFWATRGQDMVVDNDKEAAYQTLYVVLVNFVKLLAPVIPFLTEAMYQNLVRAADKTAPESVHHCLLPHTSHLSSVDQVLVDSMAVVRQAATLGHSVRASGDIKTRQPLSRALIATDPRHRQELGGLLNLLADELNVKTVDFVDRESKLVRYKFLPLNRVLGPKFGKRFPMIRRALAKLSGGNVAAQLKAGHDLHLSLENGDEVTLSSDEVLVQTQARDGLGVAGGSGLVVALDTVLTPSLVREGLAREVIRRIQELRKQAGYALSDHITVTYRADKPLAEAIRAFQGLIALEVLADSLEESKVPVGHKMLDAFIKGYAIRLAIQKSSL